MSALSQQRIGFIGGGNMAEALVRGLLKAEVAPANIRVSEPIADRRKQLEDSHGVATTAGNAELATWASLLVLAVKPQHAAVALASVAEHVGEALVLSIAAGLTTANIAKSLADGARIVRAMPNTPALVGRGATAIAKGPGATNDDLEVARRLFEAVGVCVSVSESALDAVTGLSGSGPAYVMMFIEALADGGVRAGLPRNVALSLAAQTVAGSAELQIHSGEHPAALKDRVTSPGGTTAAGLAQLEKRAFRSAVIDAVVAATARSVELGRRSS